MPFQIVRNDITKMVVDAIVNTANPSPKIGTGTDSAVYKAAGLDLMLEERKKIGILARGDAAYTNGFNLPARFVIHVVGTGWFGGDHNELEILHNCYKNSFKIAKELDCKSIAFPLISTGNYGVPKEIALKIAIDEISSFLLANEMNVYLVVYDLESYEISNKLFLGIQSFIDEHYIANSIDNEYGGIYPQNIQKSIEKSKQIASDEKSITKIPSMQIRQIQSLDEFLETKTENFQNTLQRMIAAKNLSNANVYHKSNIDKKLFSKIISNKDYVPKKRNVMAFVIGLELDMEQAEVLLSSAGFAFSSSDKSDLIVKYFIMQKNYNIFELNEVLFKYGLPLLGNLSE